MGIELELAHYGVKGMKWGTRKDRKSGRKAAKQHIKMVNPYRIASVHKRLEYDKAAQEQLEQIVRHYRKDFQARVRDLERINSGG